MSTPPRIEPTLEPATTPSLTRPGPELRPERSLRPPSYRERSSFIGHFFIFLLTLLGLLLLVIVALRWLPPPTTSYMLQSPTKPVQYQWVPANQINDSMRQAVVAAEDQKFWSHQGFDFEAIQKAEEYNRNARHHRRGASTISQQTAKNLFLWPGGWVRKGLEAGLTVLIEHLWGKPRILEMYLNVAEFGPGIYGVGAASQAYFGKPAALLTYQDAARLAAVLPNPRQWSVRSPGAYVQARTAWILGQMGQGGTGAPEREPQPTPADLQGVDQDEALQPADPDAAAPPADSTAPPADPASAPAVEVPSAAPQPAPAAANSTAPADTPTPAEPAAPEPATPAQPAATPPPSTP